jgi:ankyrin repeat protein
VNLLCCAGADLDLLDCDGKSALHVACAENHYDVIVQLLRCVLIRTFVFGVLDYDGKSALHVACAKNHYDVIVQLLRCVL